MAQERIDIRRQELSQEVVSARERHEEAERHNSDVLLPRIALHLDVHEKLLDRLDEYHAMLVERTDLDPAAVHRPAGAWLLCGRCLSLARAAVALLRAGFSTEAEPTARALNEACRMLPLILDPEEEQVWRRWHRGRGWANPKELLQAEREHETRQAARILRLGYRPPERTADLGASVYANGR